MTRSKKIRITYIVLTIFFAVLFCVLKMMSLGWLSVLGFMLITVYLAFYILFGIDFANLKNKTRSRYVFFWVISFLLIFFAVTFCDFVDVGPTLKILKFVPDEILLCICSFSFVVGAILLAIALITNKKYKGGKSGKK